MHLILLNTAPASAEDLAVMREHPAAVRTPAEREGLRRVADTDEYRAGDLAAEAEYFRLHFRAAVRDDARLEDVVGRLRTHFTPDGVRMARAIDQRLYDGTWASEDYDLLPKLRALAMPALVLHGSDDFVPVSVAARIAEALPRARLVVLEGCGHFSYVEAPDAVHEHVVALFR